MAVMIPIVDNALNPIWPKLWMPRLGRRGRFDLALGQHADVWHRHPILGDPSYDSFVRHSDKPFVRGKAPLRWPVNGFLFEDPVSRNWYAYVGYYLEGYDIGPGRPITHCRIWKSTDRGGSWSEVGPLFRDPEFRFDGDPHPANVAPDVAVVYDAGRYVLAYDWINDNADWAAAAKPGPGADGGVGIAVADHPEGPWRRVPKPVLRTSEWQRKRAGNPRYRRPYATSLIRRRNDWLLLTDVDSGPHFAWGLVASTAPSPEGPWSDPVLVKDLEGDDWLPAPVESFPAFANDGYVYDPRTSVGRNRNYQLLWRAPIERAHRRDAWEPYQEGSLWHSEPTIDEGEGIWGQTLAGFVDRFGQWNVLFPTRAFPGGGGTIRTASRPWKQPLKTRGFVLSAHGAPTATRTRFHSTAFHLDALLERRGGAARIVWGWQSPLGTRGRADGEPHPWVKTRHHALELSDTGWRWIVSAETVEREIASGPWEPGGTRSRVAVGIRCEPDGRSSVTLDGKRVAEWDGPLSTGAFGFWLEPRTHVLVEKFYLECAPQSGIWTHLWTEGIAGAGVAEGDYEETESRSGRYGRLARCVRPGERVKWNFRGTGFRLWLPKGPDWGRISVVLDGMLLDEIDLHSRENSASRVVLERAVLPDARHTLVVRSLAGPMPVDCLDALQGVAGPPVRR